MTYIEYLVAEKAKGNQARLGLLFDTPNNHYFLDTGTNKVVLIDDPLGHEFLNLFITPSISLDAFRSFIDSHLNDDPFTMFLQQLEAENLLKAFEVDALHLLSPGRSYEDLLMNCVQQLTLEVTGKCNFRCKYCIYSEEHDGNRDFNNEDMTWETAKSAIDYTFAHSGDSVAITFYGGEPLINYKLIKESIDYSLSKKGDKELTFSLTSNMSLMTEEMAEYFASIPGLSLIASIDGPEMMHNAFRVYANNKPTFDDTVRGLELIARAFKKTGNEMMVNAVYTPPYSYAKSKQMSEFYESLPFLNGVQITVSYPSRGSLHNVEEIYEVSEDSNTFHFDKDNPLSTWAWDSFVNGSNSPMANRHMFERLKGVHFRRLLDAPMNHYPMNACCVPGVRRLYVETNGNLALCERIGTAPRIGNVYTGVDQAKATQFYIDGYEAASLPECSRCWAVNMCSICYANCYSSDGVDMTEKRSLCFETREQLMAELQMYHYLLEEYPDKLAELFKDVELV